MSPDPIGFLNSGAGAIAVSLWRASWQGGAALALVWGRGGAVAGLPPRLRCWLWRLAYIKLLAALVWSTPLSLPLRTSQTSSISQRAPDGQDQTQADPMDSSGLATHDSRPTTAPLATDDSHATLATLLLPLWLSGVGWGGMRIA